MTRSKNQSLPFPTVLGALRAGFDLTTRYWWLVLVPLALDVFYWLGPRLHVGRLFAQLMRQTVGVAAGQNAGIVDASSLAMLTEVAGSLNLMTLLSIPLWGVPALMDGVSPPRVPLSPLVFEVAGWGRFVGFYLLLTLIGVAISAFYFRLIAGVVHGQRTDWRALLRTLLPDTLRLGLMLVAVLLAIMLMLMPIALVAVAAGVFGPALVMAVLLGGSVLIVWTVLFVTFALQALFLQRLPPLAALVAGVRFLQQQLAVALPLLLAVFLINTVGASLWRRADDGSWLTIISLTGHAFVATAMFVSLFVFYRDRTALAATQPAAVAERRLPSS